MDDFLKSVLLLFVLLNPFIMSVYLAELIKGVEIRTLSQHLIRAAVISIIVFSFFAWVGATWHHIAGDANRRQPNAVKVWPQWLYPFPPRIGC